MVYSLPYLALLVTLLILAVVYEQRREDAALCHKLSVCGILAFTLFFAFRGYVFTDWTAYYEEFSKLSWGDLFVFKLGETHEPLFVLFELTCKTLIDDFLFFQMTDTLLAIWLLLRFFRRYSDNVLICLALFMAFAGVEIICNLMRNVIALGIFLNAIPYMEQRKPLPYFGLCLLAIGFHFSALIYLPLYFFFHFRMNKWIYVGIVMLCLAVFLLRVPVFMRLVSLLGIGGEFMEMKIDAYAETAGSLGLGMGFLERVITAGLIFCYYDRLQNMRPENKIFINAFVAYFFCLFMFSEFQEISKRMSLLFIFSYWILWHDLIKVFAIENNRRLFIAFLGLYCMVKTMTTIVYPYCQYDNMLTGNIKSYQERLYIFNTTFKEPD